jgi:flagellar basal body-associated protein FliL
MERKGEGFVNSFCGAYQMSLVAEEKEPKPKSKRHSFLIAIAVALCLFIAVDVSLIIFIAGRDKSAEPKKMVLRDTSNETVLVGTTKQDLEQAMDSATK